MKLGTSSGTPAIMFQPSRKPGTEAWRIWVISWMKLPARYKARIATKAAISPTPSDSVVIAIASPA